MEEEEGSRVPTKELEKGGNGLACRVTHAEDVLHYYVCSNITWLGLFSASSVHQLIAAPPVHVQIYLLIALYGY